MKAISTYVNLMEKQIEKNNTEDNEQITNVLSRQIVNNIRTKSII